MTSTRSPRLSLGLPTYNGERYLAGALDTLLAQTFTDFELIISDNASTDGTEAICRAYAASDPRIRYVRQPRNMGGTFNHNFVIQQSRGAYFKWVADDDLYHPDLLQRCMEAVDAQRDAVCVHSWTAMINEAGELVEKVDYPLTTDVPSAPERFRSLLYTRGGDDSYGIMPMSVLGRMAPFGSYHLADRTFVAELALHGRFYNVPDYLYYRREHPNRVTTVGARSLRTRCARWDPRRANRWRHPVVRLVGEYLLAYVTAIWRAPLSGPDRLRCYWHLAVWILAHAERLRPRLRPRLRRGQEPTPAGTAKDSR